MMNTIAGSVYIVVCMPQGVCMVILCANNDIDMASKNIRVVS